MPFYDIRTERELLCRRKQRRMEQWGIMRPNVLYNLRFFFERILFVEHLGGCD